jgi:hypothetical protein
MYSLFVQDVYRVKKVHIKTTVLYIRQSSTASLSWFKPHPQHNTSLLPADQVEIKSYLNNQLYLKTELSIASILFLSKRLIYQLVQEFHKEAYQAACLQRRRVQNLTLFFMFPF